MRRRFPDSFGTTPTPDMNMVGKGLVSKGPSVSPRRQASCRDRETNSGAGRLKGGSGMGVLER